MGCSNPKAKKVLLVEPDYYSRYPPLGLLKISSYYKSIGAKVKYVRGLTKLRRFTPDTIEITTLFTYSRKQVHNAIAYYSQLYPRSKIYVGGIYASLMPSCIQSLYPNVLVQQGLNEHADSFVPDYEILSQVEKWKDWDGSIIFTSRGCINKCGFCMVPKLEGPLKDITNTPSTLVNPNHSRVILWDNNFLAQPNWYEKLEDLKKTGKWLDFNQGLDARLLTEEKAEILASLRVKDYRFAYDGKYQRKAAENAVELLSSYGVSRRKISFYTLYNFYSEQSTYSDTPDDFYHRVLDIVEWGAVSYPMRYVPLDAISKNTFISPNWTAEQLEKVAKARRVIGFGGAFPPYNALVDKFKKAGEFEEAFRLEPIKNKRE
jgi:hypothetical protein